MASQPDHRLQLKRAILSELNKELSKNKTSEESDNRSIIKTTPAKLHYPRKRPIKRTFNAQAYASAVPSKEATTKPTVTQPPTIPSLASAHFSVVDAKAKKYFFLWKEKVFGRVKNYGECVSFHRASTLRKHFSSWKEATWNKQNEWKLAVRADCHYRFTLRERCWDRWKLFMVSHKESVRKKEAADEKCKHLLQKRYFFLLRQAVSGGKDKRANDALAETIYKRNLGRKMILQWREVLRFVLIEKDKNCKALAFWALLLQRRCFFAWIRYKEETKIRTQLKAVVDGFYQQKIQVRLFNCWIAYHRQQKLKKVLNMKARKLYATKVKNRYFYEWESALVIRRKTKDLEAKLASLQKLNVLRKAFRNWKNYRAQSTAKKEQCTYADNHYQRTITAKYFKAFIQYKKIQDISRARKADAVLARRRSLLRCSFSIWIRKTDDAEEKKIKFRTLMARRFYTQQLLRQCFVQLFEYKEYRIERKQTYEVADHHFEEVIKQKAFSLWNIYVYYRRTCKIKQTSALEFNKDLLYHKYFYTWLKNYHNRRAILTEERNAEERYSRALLTRCMRLWNDRLREMCNAKKNEKLAMDHYQQKLKRCGLRAFLYYSTTSREKKDSDMKAYNHYTKRQLQKYLGSWLQYTEHRKRSNAIKLQAANHYNCKLLQSTTKSWIIYHQVISKARVVIMQQHDKANRELLSECLYQWKSEIHARKISLDLNLRAEDHYQESLKGKVLQHWATYTAAKAQLYVQQSIQLEEAKAKLDALKLKQVLHVWFDAMVKVRSDRVKEETASHFYDNLLTRKIWVALEENVKVCFKKKLLQKHLENYQQRYWIARYWSNWKKRMLQKQEDDKKIEKALLFWYVNVEHKAFRGWLRYTLKCRRKRQQYRDALEDRRKYLLNYAIRQWICTVTDKDKRHHDVALREMTKRTHRANEVALKWGKHWRNITRKRKATSQTVISCNKENIFVSDIRSLALPKSENLNFYRNFNVLKSQRPQPKIPSFLIHNKYPV